MKLIFDAFCDGPVVQRPFYIFSSALLVIACPVADMSFPAPDVVLQALSRGAAPESRRRLTRTIARFLRIGDSFDIRRSMGANEMKYCLNNWIMFIYMDILF